ncbi:MAG TPA: glutamate formimidoyltransferase [Gemmatimonadales bacterium]|nr:glutamate formimidoyltransferase [Gemmatimonadales bacterium]
MSGPLVECVPNFSEGRDAGTLAAIRAALSSADGLRLLDVHADEFHNRSVFTVAGPPHAAAEGAFRAMRVALERIDLRTHRGEHPRMGATDVIPFVPLRGITLDQCADLAREVGARAGAELDLPIYLYGRAATRADRGRLPEIRAGGFESLRERIGHDPRADPDFGPHHIHPSAGATAVGARPLLVAFNVFLRTSDTSIARQIARQIRTSSGGLPGVQAAGFSVGNQAQVSMNLFALDATLPATAFAAVATEAARQGVTVDRSEIVGLAPEDAFREEDAAALGIPDLPAHRLETRLREAGLV